MTGDERELYENRFSPKEKRGKEILWKALCEGFLSRWVKPGDTVVDIAAGYCEFINSIAAARKHAFDLNPDVERHAAEGVRCHVQSCKDMGVLADESVDVVFASNFFEHIADKQDILEILRECLRVLRKGGRLLILQPNIKYVGGRYWDYFDHHTPLTEKSLAEAVQLARSTQNPRNMAIIGGVNLYIIPRFMPYTVKGRLPVSRILILLYLRLPILWRFFGGQSFIAATKN
jgi:SAM-dependent methyltransferase